MPKAFTDCVANGHVITKSLPNGRYMHLCKTRSGKWTAGEVKRKKRTGMGSKPPKRIKRKGNKR